jgi:hypothetical protein
MKTNKLFSFLSISLLLMQACADKAAGKKSISINELSDTAYSINNDGYLKNGEIITYWDCPDSRSFPPINLSAWNKTPAVNGRLPTYKETLNGRAILHYTRKNGLPVKPYTLTLPKLAYYLNGPTPTQFYFDSATKKMILKPEVVVVIQIAQTAKDTIVGFRYLSGGVGGSVFRDFRFLTNEEVKKVVEEWKKIKIEISSLKNKFC